MNPTFDFYQIVDEMEMEPEDILHLMTLYQGELVKDLNALEHGLSEADWLLLKNLLHKMKGDAANLCLPSLSETLSLMELNLPHKDTAFLHAQLRVLETLKTSFITAFHSYSTEMRPLYENQ